MEGYKSESEVRVGDIDNKHAGLSIRRLRARRLKLAPRAKPKKNSSTSTPKRDQRVISAIPCHEVFLFLNTQLLGLLQIEYQNETKSPVEAHPIHVWTFLTSVCFYSLALGFKIHMQAQSGYFALILNHVQLVSGSLSSASLMSMFQPRLLVWLLCIIGVYILVVLAQHLLKTSLLKVFGTLVTLTFQLRDIGQWGATHA